MRDYLGEVKSAFSLVFSRGNYVFLFLLLTIVFLYLFTALRIYAAAGDNASRFFKNTPWEDLVLLLALSTGMGLLSTTQIFGVRRAVKKIESKTAGLSLASFLSGLASVVFASATCAACLGFLVSILGLPTVFAFASYSREIALFGIAIIIVSIYFTALRINEKCDECIV